MADDDKGPVIDESGSTHSKDSSPPPRDPPPNSGGPSRFERLKRGLSSAGSRVAAQAKKDFTPRPAKPNFETQGYSDIATSKMLLASAKTARAKGDHDTAESLERNSARYEASGRINLAKSKGQKRLAKKQDRLTRITNAIGPTRGGRIPMPFGGNMGMLYGGMPGSRGGGRRRGSGGLGGGRLPNPNDLYGLSSYGRGQGRGSLGVGFSMEPPEDFFGMSSFGRGQGGGGGGQRRGRGRPRKYQQDNSGGGMGGFGGDPMRDFYGF